MKTSQQVFIITDGEDDIRSSFERKISRDREKTRLFLLLTEVATERHALHDLDATIIQVNRSAEIISRNTD